jgi:GAF domain-containing protein
VASKGSRSWPGARHPGSVVLTDVGGASLAGVAKPLTVGELIGVASALARAVAGMHRRGVMEDRLIRGAFTAERLDAVKLIAAQLAVSLDNAQLYAELAASRARIVAAADQARRRIERDLHDGAQQRLVSLALRLRFRAGGHAARIRGGAGRCP